MVGSAIRFLAAKAAKAQAQAQAQVKVQAQTQTQTLVGSIQLLCHVKPGVSANREGIAAVSDDAVEVCVAAQAREGEANKAVREVIAQVLNVPKSDVEIAKGMKGREKTVVVSNIKSKSKTTEEEVERIRIILERSAGRL